MSRLALDVFPLRPKASSKMPYAMPAPQSPDDERLDLPPLKLRTHHRRVRSANPSFSDERGPGAFTPLPHLPRRKSIANKEPMFHFNEQDSDSSDDCLPSMNSLGLTVDTTNLPTNIPNHHATLQPSSLPFPSKGSPAPTLAPPSPVSPPGAALPRTPSTPVIFLANGKPLKPSLKSSHSSPNIPGLQLHTRAHSEPSTPSGQVKNVHFAEKEALQSIRVFDKSGRPASVSKSGPAADETETETEYDSSNNVASNSYPFPVLPPTELTFELHSTLTSPVPAPNPPQYASVHLETLVLPRSSPPMLRGSVVVRNIAFAKEVAVRFTLDDWQTTSEVICKHVASLPSIPPPFREPSTLGDIAAAASASPVRWDRFVFVVRLEDFERKLSEKTLYLVVRYTVPGSGEWWDNNSSSNYRVSFQQVRATQSSGAPSGSPVMNHSQQRTFSAPPTLKGTPTAAAVVYEQARANTSPEPVEARHTPYALPNLSAPVPHSRQGPGRSSSFPHPPVKSAATSHPYSLTPSRYSLPTKLNLLNYAAPSTPPRTPPRSRSSSLSTVEDDMEAEEAHALSPRQANMSTIIGGMPATAPQTVFPWPTPSSPPSSSLSSPSEETRQDGASASALPSDSSYAAFVKQWCFAQSPAPVHVPGSTPRTVPQNNWLGTESYGVHSPFGGAMRSDSPMVGSM